MSSDVPQVPLKKGGGVFCRIISVLFWDLFSLLAPWLLGVLAFRLLGFSASCWFMRLLVAFWFGLLASSAFPVPLPTPGCFFLQSTPI